MIGQIPMRGDASSNVVQAANKGLIRLQEAVDGHCHVVGLAGGDLRP